MIRGFRIWDNQEKTYNVMADLVISPTGHLMKMSFSNGGIWEYTYADENRYIVELDTGLKDKNGKEIYEGDILEQFVCGVHNFKGKKCGRSTIWQVRWNKKECCFELHYLRGSLFADSMMSDGDDYEVIGNIHENPELLGGEK